MNLLFLICWHGTWNWMKMVLVYVGMISGRRWSFLEVDMVVTKSTINKICPFQHAAIRYLQDFSNKITIKLRPWRSRREASWWLTPGARLEKLWKVVKKCQIVAISEKYTLNQQINKISWAFSNPACLLKRRTVSMRRRRSISEVVPTRKSIHMFGLFSCFLLLVVKLKA